MALKLDERYPGRANPPSIDYPQGSFKNRTSPDSKDGTYLEQDWANDQQGFFQSLLSKAGVVANGLVDKVGASQYFDALKMVIAKESPGRLINIQYFKTPGSFVYTPTAGTSKIVVEVQGAGGAGGGAYYAPSGQLSAGGGGGSGAYARKLINSNFSGTSISVGAGGTGVVAGIGRNGSESSFGSLITAPGGLGGSTVSGTSSFPSYAGGGAQAPASSGGDINSGGTAGSLHLLINESSAFGGDGAPSYFGGGGGRNGNGNGFAGSAPGAGGGGACRPQNSSTGASGGPGAAGIVVVWEYS